PPTIAESARIDGAGEFKIFMKLILPLSKPVLASMGLFMALNYWNDWFNAMLFIDKQSLIPLQFYLYELLSKIEVIRLLMSRVPEMAGLQMPEESFKMAMAVVTIGPIILLYP